MRCLAPFSIQRGIPSLSSCSPKWVFAALVLAAFAVMIFRDVYKKNYALLAFHIPATVTAFWIILAYLRNKGLEGEVGQLRQTKEALNHNVNRLEKEVTKLEVTEKALSGEVTDLKKTKEAINREVTSLKDVAITHANELKEIGKTGLLLNAGLIEETREIGKVAEHLATASLTEQEMLQQIQTILNGLIEFAKNLSAFKNIEEHQQRLIEQHEKMGELHQKERATLERFVGYEEQEKAKRALLAHLDQNIAELRQGIHHVAERELTGPLNQEGNPFEQQDQNNEALA